ncbi:deoxyhypusine synthase [candidate division WOR-3 bacterium]|nr:deoxyhypusine synthase [candidate division WOR-3 bacterium]
MDKKEYLKDTVEHIDIKSFDSKTLVEQYGKMAFQARNLHRAALIFDEMIKNRDCTVIMCLAGSIFSAGLKRAVLDLIQCNIVDAVVSTGAIIVDQDFFEALGFRHYIGHPSADDDDLMKNTIDRIYDTYIDEDELRICDETVKIIADRAPTRPYSSREFLMLMGDYLIENKKGEESLVRKAREKGVPIFVPAFSDCSAGFGLVSHQAERKQSPKVTIDSVKDFLELTKLKLMSRDTGLFMIGGGVPKNFAQDITVAAEILGEEVNMHKYAVQITVADERDGGLSGSTLKEAHSWGKVDQGAEQMVFSEATIAFPLIASYVYHRNNWQARQPRNFNKVLEEEEK